MCLFPRQSAYISRLPQYRTVTIFRPLKCPTLQATSPLSINEGTHSLAQNLPPEFTIEIVLEIFEAQWDVAWTVASVCRSWRFAALNVTGYLWSRICIPVGTIPHALARRTLPNKRIGGPITPFYLDLRRTRR